MMKHLFIISLLGSISAVHAVEDWKPVFEHRPITTEEAAQMERAMPGEAFESPAEPRRVLIYSATAGFRHRSIPVGLSALETLGESTGAYSAVISDDPAHFETDKLTGFDAVILLNTTGDFFMPDRDRREGFSATELEVLQTRNDRLLDNLVAYVEKGGGLVGIHSATDSCYNHEEYGDMIGGYFHGHPWNAEHNVTIVVEDKEHILNQLAFKDVDEFQLREEIYQFRDPYSRDRLRILLHLDVDRSDEPRGELRREDNDYPVAFLYVCHQIIQEPVISSL